MRFFILSLLFALFFASALAVKQQKAVIITYPEETPKSEVDKAISVLKEAGGVITHEYKLIKGFAAKASDAALEAVRTLGDKHIPLIEEDSMVSIDGTVLENGKTE
ncbi:uncharacterized protein HMPREF1541_10791 [Cyphellophora europaea CBS 101466]|uniref:Inhibitor I9 domain-containing protein n=1 Tax=Cyphellophora europaea (strain CBS 101466) TaxID=1220924 RepID=W2S6I4_CYPE1|nr:uncharacterized protein HMPREF1541_10791 [Cyphellophora europaea CBS 101466]ETN44240.1 hypothetical protein HMPREF1541_10791 [Cyphellophora europaea CBS 101466]